MMGYILRFRSIPWICLLWSWLVAMPGSIFAQDGVERSTEFAEFHEYPIEDYEREHWSFSPIVRPMIPDVQNLSWVENEIDHFILRELEKQELPPSPRASKASLLRRVKFDLIGLPPTPDEFDRFLSDDSTHAYEKLVERFLSDPGYGERWGQFWLDLARFAETDGFEHDKLRPQAWKYRQWVVEALNKDMPYDQFIGLQLAGDLLETGSQAVATGFCLAGPDMPDINEQDLRRHDKLNEITATIGASLLGLQLGCAQCHDHKYDPISQADFYRLRAVFEPAVPLLKRDKPIVQLAAQTLPEPSHLYFRGELTGKGPTVSAAPPRIASWEACVWDEKGEDPRLRFVEWMFDSNNPLVARVIANRIWQYHFGRSLAGNPSDFGVVAAEPLHPELLNWLAVFLQDSSWSIKKLHRKILLSATYRQAGSSDGLNETATAKMRQSVEHDPDNDWYGRFPRKRLEGEIIRDALLAVAGLGNRGYGGPSVMPPLPKELKQTLLRGQWQESKQISDHHRRSIYVFARRNLRYPIFDVFDRPDAGATCPQRNVSTTALQSLQLLNSDLAIQSARALSRRLIRRNPSRTAEYLIRDLFRITLSRNPSSKEVHLMSEALPQDSDINESLFVLCLALLNSNEFIYVD